MKKISYWLFAALLLAASACTDNEDDDAKAGANDIASGVSWLGQQIILADRNFGATGIDGIGAFLNYADAETACPEGYHLMTISEAKALIADSRYSTPEKFLAAFHIPYSSYIAPEPSVSSMSRTNTSLQNEAFLHVLGSTLIIDNTDPEDPYFSFDRAPEFFQMNLRCVKGEAIVQKSSVSGSIQIAGDITMTPKYAGLAITYTDDTKTTIYRIWLVLSSDEPVDEYESEPEEYISLNFIPDPTNSGQYSLVSGIYKMKSTNKRVPLFQPGLTTNSTLEYNPSKKSFTLTLDTKNGTTQTAKGSAQGTYIAMPDRTADNQA